MRSALSWYFTLLPSGFSYQIPPHPPVPQETPTAKKGGGWLDKMTPLETNKDRWAKGFWSRGGGNKSAPGPGSQRPGGKARILCRSVNQQRSPMAVCISATWGRVSAGLAWAPGVIHFPLWAGLRVFFEKNCT